MITNSKCFYIDAEQRISGNPSSFSYTIQIPAYHDYDRVSLLQANIPTSFYIVANDHNTFVLTEGAINTTITITAGNYSVKSFLTTVQTLLNTYSPNHWVYSITFPNAYTSVSTAKYTFNVTGNASQPAFTFSDHLYEQFGCNANSTTSFSANKLISPNVVKFILKDTIYIHSDIVINSEKSILQDIYNNNTTGFSNIIFQCPDVLGYSKALNKNNSNVYHFDITDEHGHIIDFNGLNPSFTIILFRRDNLTEILKKYIKFSVISQN